MRIESELCHLSENKAIVKINAWLNEKNMGSALAEGATVEIAEDRAIMRLNERLNKISNNKEGKNSQPESNISKQKIVELPKSNQKEATNFSDEPSDWSNDLLAIDLEIKRLNWTRDDENYFLEKNLGYNSRNRITKYKELITYLKMLKNIDNLHESKKDSETISTLIEESEVILNELSWDHKKGREFLQNEFNVSTRKELDVNQMASFVNKLKSIRNNYLSN